MLAGNIKAADLFCKEQGALRFLLEFEHSKNTRFGGSCPFVCSLNERCLAGQISPLNNLSIQIRQSSESYK